MTVYGFVRLRRGLYEHLRSCRINQNEFVLYIVLLGMVDYETGVVFLNTTELEPYLRNMDRASIKRALEGLEEKHYIKRFPKQGSHNPYPVLIDKWEVYEESKRVARINAASSTDWQHPVVDIVSDTSMKRPRSAFEASMKRTRGDHDASMTPPEADENTINNAPKEIEIENKKEEYGDEGPIETPVNFKIYQEAFKSVAGKTPQPYTGEVERYSELVRKYGETEVLEAIEEYVEEEGGRGVTKKNKWASRNFLLRAAEDILDARIDDKNERASRGTGELPQLEIPEQ